MSYVTIELDCNNRLIQVRGKYHEMINDEVRDVIRKWQKSLVIYYFE